MNEIKKELRELRNEKSDYLTTFADKYKSTLLRALKLKGLEGEVVRSDGKHGYIKLEFYSFSSAFPFILVFRRLDKGGEIILGSIK